MRKTIVGKRLVFSMLVAAALSGCAQDQDEVASVSSDLGGVQRYLVMFRSETLPADAATRIAKAGGTVNRKLGQVGLMTVRGNEAFATKLAKDSAVLAVGRERMMKLAPTRTAPATAVEPTDWASWLQWDMRRINAPELWGRTIPASSVAVLDTGVMDDHPDLAGQVCETKATNYCRTSGGPSNTPSYPIYDTVIDFNTGEECAPTTPIFHFHGTHVSGTIAAKLDGNGVVGVSPTSCIAAYKVFDRYRFFDGVNLIDDVGAFDFAIFDAIVDATLGGRKVINMSLGGQLDRSTRDGNTAYLAWDRVAKWANRNGMLIVAAAGNETTNNNGTVAFIPSDLSTVMSVSATGTSQLVGDANGNLLAAPGSDVVTFYSNFGAAVDISAPGGDCGPLFPNDCDPFHLIPSTCIDMFSGAADWCWAAGTSMAAPHVAAVAGAVRALHPTWSPGATRSWLKDTSQPVAGRQGFGAGIVDADRATR
jgi:lantibiotic leader peptide-processing serine protease